MGRNGNGSGLTLGMSCGFLSGWLSPKAMDGGETSRSGARKHELLMGGQARATVGWVTPSARDWKDNPGMSYTTKNPDGSTRIRTDLVPRQAGLTHLSAEALSRLKKPDGSWISGVGLNPDLCRWLMGFPVEWSYHAPASSLTRKTKSKAD